MDGTGLLHWLAGLDFSWMAWTWPTALFSAVIFLLLVVMAIWEVLRPGGAQRIRFLRFETTSGDRRFRLLLGSAFLHLAWLVRVGPAPSGSPARSRIQVIL